MDIFTPAVMDTLTSMMPKQDAFFKNTFFKMEKPEPTTKIMADFYKGKRRVAPFVSDKEKSKVTEKIGYTTDTFETPIVRVKDVTNIDDLMKRMAGEQIFSGRTPSDRAIEMLANTLTEFDEQITRREELMCAQAMLNGVITVKGENVDYTIDFGFTNKATLTTKWDAANSTADPLADLKGMAVVCQKNGYRKPNICIMERSAYDAFIKRCVALGYLNQLNFLDLQIAPSVTSENVTFVGRLKDPAMELYIYDEWYIDDWTSTTPTEKSIMPKGKILLASTNAKFSLYYGVQTFTDPNTREFRSIMGSRAADSWVQKDPDTRILTLNSRPLPIPHEVDSWYVAEVSATV